jgi:hypothetical protein
MDEAVAVKVKVLFWDLFCFFWRHLNEISCLATGSAFQAWIKRHDDS